MLGETGTEQFVITTLHDDKLIAEQRIHDPFIHSTTVVCLSRWDTFKAFLRGGYKTKIRTNVGGSLAVQRAIMMMDPVALEAENQKIFLEHEISRQYGGANNFIATAPE